VMNSAPQLLPPPGEGTVADNLRAFIDGGIATLLRVTPAFAGLIAQPKVLARFHAMVGGDPAFDPASADGGDAARDGGPGLPDLLTTYLRGEQRLGRVGADVDIDAAAALIVGAMHGQILPRVLFTPPGSPVTIPPGLGARLADTVLDGIAPPSRRSPRDGGA